MFCSILLQENTPGAINYSKTLWHDLVLMSVSDNNSLPEMTKNTNSKKTLISIEPKKQFGFDSKKSSSLGKFQSTKCFPSVFHLCVVGTWWVMNRIMLTSTSTIYLLLALMITANLAKKKLCANAFPFESSQVDGLVSKIW